MAVSVQVKGGVLVQGRAQACGAEGGGHGRQVGNGMWHVASMWVVVGIGW